MWYHTLLDWLHNKNSVVPTVKLSEELQIGNVEMTDKYNQGFTQNDARGRGLYLTSPIQYLDLPNYDGTKVHTHPSTLYFPRGFAGFEFWKAYTPYTTVRNENPCLVASNDGINWVVPNGVTNPLDPDPGEPSYNSDAELVRTGATSMRVYWRQMPLQGETETKIFYRDITANGATVVLSDRQQCTFTPYRDMLSPSVVKDKDGWKCWGGSGSGAPVLYTSTDGVNWINPVTCVTNFNPTAGFWHPFVYCTPWGYEMTCNIAPINWKRSSNAETGVYFGRSKDGVKWYFDHVPFIPLDPSVYNYRAYRTSVVPIGEEWLVYPSGITRVGEKIGFARAKRANDPFEMLRYLETE